MAEVTRKHRAKAHECIYGSIDGEGGSGYGRRYIDWVQAGGKIDHDLQSVAQALANIEAEARSAATQSGVNPLSLLDELEREWKAGSSNDEGENIGDALTKLRAKYSPPKGDTDG